MTLMVRLSHAGFFGMGAHFCTSNIIYLIRMRILALLTHYKKFLMLSELIISCL